MVVCKVAKRQGKRKEIFKKEPFQTKEPANKQNARELLILVFIVSNLGHNHQIIGSSFAKP